MLIKNYFNSKPLQKNNFVPPFCPNPQCKNYANPPDKPNWCKHIGFFTRKNGEKIPRWLCLQTNSPHSFSYASFECTYWLKKRELLVKIAQNLGEQSSLRGLARTLNVSQNCIYRQAMRIGRHCLVLQQMALNSINSKKLGTLVFDELESWEISQFVPTTHPLFMDAESGFKLALLCSPINRKGRMTSLQTKRYKKWIATYGKLPKSNSRQLIRQILQLLSPLYKNKKNMLVATDKKKMYFTELKRQWQELNFDHKRYSSKVGRHVGYMGKINQEDQYIRQRCSTMRRESLDFMKRHNNTCLRHAIYLLKRNFVMAECRTKRRLNPAVRLGLLVEPTSWNQVFSQRIVNGVSLLPSFLKKVYMQQCRTPFYKNNQLHSAAYAI